MDNKKRIYSLDYLKYIACFLVIIIHMDISPTLELWISPFLRIAVPIFFMITGFFYNQIYNAGKAGKQIKKVAVFAVIANLLHIAWEISKLILNGDSIKDYLHEVIQPSALIELLCFNQPIWRTSIWYINALLYVLVLVYILQKSIVKDIKVLYPMIPILLIGNFVLGTYAPTIFGESIGLFYSRNFLFCGLPYFLLGSFLSRHNVKIKNTWLFLLVIAFYSVTLTEHKLLSQYNLLHHQDLFIGTTFLAVAIFAFFIQNEDWFGGKVGKTLAGYGRKYSFVIYIIHSIIIEVFSKIISAMGAYTAFVEQIFRWCGPIIVLICSTILAVVWEKISKKIKH